jgi:acyl-CoA synthetase (AMP-forming)/AMP-acid ligase II
MQFFLIRTRCKYELQHGVCCCRLPDEEAGEVPAAYVVLRPGAEASAEEIIEFIDGQVAHYKRVRHLEFIEAVPKSASGKILRRELKTLD